MFKTIRVSRIVRYATKLSESLLRGIMCHLKITNLQKQKEVPYLQIAIQSLRKATVGQVDCDNHPFFSNLLQVSKELKSFYKKVRATRGDTFESCLINSVPIKKLMLEELFLDVPKLKAHTILTFLVKLYLKQVGLIRLLERLTRTKAS